MSTPNRYAPPKFHSVNGVSLRHLSTPNYPTSQPTSENTLGDIDGLIKSAKNFKVIETREWHFEIPNEVLKRSRRFVNYTDSLAGGSEVSTNILE